MNDFSIEEKHFKHTNDSTLKYSNTDILHQERGEDSEIDEINIEDELNEIEHKTMNIYELQTNKVKSPRTKKRNTFDMVRDLKIDIPTEQTEVASCRPNINKKTVFEKDSYSEANYLHEKLKIGSNYAYRDDSNPKFRQQMEDFYALDTNFCNQTEVFCIFDGHGGKDPVLYVKDNFLLKLREEFETENNWEEAFRRAFEVINTKLKFCDSETSGCTASILLLEKTYDETSREYKRSVHSANVGDSKAFLVGLFGAVQLTVDHNVKDKEEERRIKQSEGKIINNRVGGVLALTRALGDHALSSSGVVCTPSYSKTAVQADSRFLVVASDGLWDVVEADELLDFSLKVGSSTEFTNLLLNVALERHSKDNISCFTVCLS